MAKARRQDNAIAKEIQAALLDDEEFMKSIVQNALQAIMNEEFQAHLQALPYERTKERKGYRNGSYTRRLKTRVGSIELQVLRDREGVFKSNIFNSYQRSEKALILSMVEMYIQGVSTRRVKRVVDELCGIEISAGRVSQLSKQLDETISNWRERPIEKNYPYIMIDARYEDIREDGVVKSKAVMLVIGIDESGKREILSVDIGDSESEESWEGVFKNLRDRGLKDVLYAVSDNNNGLVKALKKSFSGLIWQRCQVHFMRNFTGKLSVKERKKYMAQLQDIFNAPDIKQARERKNKLVEKLYSEKRRNLSMWLDNEIEYCFNVYNLPVEHRKRMKSTNMIERLNEEILRRTRVVRIFPNEASCIRLISSISIEISELWQTGKKYLNMDLLKERELLRAEEENKEHRESRQMSIVG